MRESATLKLDRGDEFRVEVDSDDLDDAIHLDAAIQLNRRGAIDAVLTFDHQLQAGCAHHALAVETPIKS